ncbi:MAG: DUF881 domain-containing protein [Schwartzia sp.]|nr:DUF881 domain-containing protein [Schwartzia sp. (in: firmicutes)]
MITYKRGHLSIAFVCMVLGFMLALQFRIAMDQKSSLPYQRVEELSARLIEAEKERDALQEQVASLQNAQPTPDGTAEGERRLRELRLRSGLTPLVGPGVVVTIDDSKIQSKAGENQNLYIIHDDDLLKVINELRAAGAEAISVNGQRLVATSEIRCAGPTLSVNNVRSAPPYEIRAIGDSATLESALRMRGGVMETLQVWGIQLEVKAAQEIVVPAYKGAAQFSYAKEAEEGTL